MPGSWYEVSGHMGSITNLFDIKGRSTSTSYRLIEGKSAAELLQKIDKILRDAKEVLQDYSKLLPEEQLKALQGRHRRLKRKTCEENSEDRLNEDQRVRDSSILSQAFKDRQTHYERVRNLLVKAEVFHTDVVTASRHADGSDSEDEFPDMVSSPKKNAVEPSNQGKSQLSECLAWFPVPNPRTNSSHRSEPSRCQPMSECSVDSDSATCVDTEDIFIAAVTQIPINQGQDPNTYRRMMILEGNGELTVLADPRFHRMDEIDPYTTDESLQALSYAGIDVLKHAKVRNEGQPNPDITEGLSLASIIEAFRNTTLMGVV